MIALLVTLVGDAQAALLTITQVTTLPFVSVVDVYEELFVPALFPFTFH